jgi:hypothetical protein
MSSMSVRSATGAQASTVRPGAAPARTAIATELAASQAVTSASGSDPVRQDVPHAQADPHDMVLDAQSREILLRTAEARMTPQPPDVAARLKAYARPARKHAREPHADIEA